MRDCYASAIPCLIEASGAEADISLLDAVAHLSLALGYSRLLTATDALRFQQVLALIASTLAAHYCLWRHSDSQ